LPLYWLERRSANGRQGVLCLCRLEILQSRKYDSQEKIGGPKAAVRVNQRSELTGRNKIYIYIYIYIYLTFDSYFSEVLILYVVESLLNVNCSKIYVSLDIIVFMSLTVSTSFYIISFSICMINNFYFNIYNFFSSIQPINQSSNKTVKLFYSLNVVHSILISYF